MPLGVGQLLPDGETLPFGGCVPGWFPGGRLLPLKPGVLGFPGGCTPGLLICGPCGGILPVKPGVPELLGGCPVGLLTCGPCGGCAEVGGKLPGVVACGERGGRLLVVPFATADGATTPSPCGRPFGWVSDGAEAGPLIAAPVLINQHRGSDQRPGFCPISNPAERPTAR